MKSVISLAKNYLSGMARYNFVTMWEVPYPVEPIWDMIYHMDRWPEWWKYVKSVQTIKAGGEHEIGTVRRITWSTALPYSITFDSELIRLEMLERIEGKVSGDLSGTGIWTFSSNKQGTLVRYDWTVVTTRWWMNYVAPVARPLFKWNHDTVMKAGYKGLLQKCRNG